MNKNSKRRNKNAPPRAAVPVLDPRLSLLQHELEQLQSSYELLLDAEASREAITQEHEHLKQKLHSANLKYREATSKVSELKQTLDNYNQLQLIQSTQLQATQTQLQVSECKIQQWQGERNTLQGELLRSKLALADARAQQERLQQKVLEAQQQAVRIKSTLSFQLGNALIFAFKSWADFGALPGRLWQLRKTARLRREATKLSAINHPPKMERLAPPSLRKQGTATEKVIESKLPIPQTTDELVKLLRNLKVAAVMDEFTASSYAPECQLQQLTPGNWHAELQAFQPHLLFIESAWRGKDDLWGSKIGHRSQELQNIVVWCRQHNVPTLFWNKEDPVHFETFLNTARLFDHVFTTDLECVPRYKAALGHNRVYFLPFAAQPTANNPIEKYPRQDGFCFAGAYYARYPERTRDLGNLLGHLSTYKRVEIYDRNYGKDHPDYRFPAEYQPFIVGTLPYDQIDKAYKGYRYAINLNSIKQSQTMFARRVYELLASNTLTVSNFSRGVRLMFGDLVACTDSGEEMLRHLQTLAGDETAERKLRLAALRKAMGEHVYQERLAYIWSKVANAKLPTLLPGVVVLGYARTQTHADALLAHFDHQRYPHKRLVLVAPQYFQPSLPEERADIELISSHQAEFFTVRQLLGEGEWLAPLVPEDYYGPHYLSDLILASRYTPACVIGKAAHYTYSANRGLQLLNRERAYTAGHTLPLRAAIARDEALAGHNLRDWVSTLYTGRYDNSNGFAIDEFHYCVRGMQMDAATRAILDDLPELDTGLPLAQLQTHAENAVPVAEDSSHLPQLSATELVRLFAKGPANSKVRLEAEGASLSVDSRLEDGVHEYWYASQTHSPQALGANSSRLALHLETTPGLNIQLVVLFLDKAGQRIGHVIHPTNRNIEINLPAGAANLRLGLRIYAGGCAQISSLLLAHKKLEPGTLLGRGRHLVLTNHYPSYEDLYRNGFVHSRVRAYRQHGVRCDVFRLRENQATSYHEFEGVDVATGSAEALQRLLADGAYQSVLVHFLDEAMWRVLSQHVEHTQIIVWVHGAEIQPLHRREYSISSEEQRRSEQLKSDQRMAFWHGLLRMPPAMLKLVFVSRYLAETVMEDLGFRLPETSYAIIPNPIDTDIFSYQPKPAEQRKKILSIRPYASRTYANDLSVKAILELSKEPFFSELEFRLIGDGKLFDETLAPLRGLSNVHIERRFLKQAEIAALHKEYGIFLCPSRMDTQGVSRDEAMASGLVPITNAVAAIPEFVHWENGMLSPPEDWDSLKKSIITLINDGGLFSDLSRNAAVSRREKLSKSRIITHELSLINKRMKNANK
ncbi:glycosyltransferase [Chromobacterium sp. IIBBL 290-4]|uniref:glycosyltransferase n=1 Tax=Chromobacterium sp. IIBBL 290-4 TaxID=2953890 RepID=UPI0020B89F95|nr:glycosyltransferase [Chromobacterium sp. IIBBL 290-4]UTH76251.1 glycosyltransferase [Chromobacterium sp. IIBBL 290-4]